jgi:hypothetical protein
MRTPTTRHAVVIQLLLSFFFATFYFLLWSHVPPVDDGGIVLRYMDNFAKGAFFAYNPSDGPVYGVSGPLHAVLAGTLSYLQLLSPQYSLYASNYLGLVLVLFFTLRILLYVTPRWHLAIPAWLVALSAAPSFVVNIKQGLETPLHLAIILLCILMTWQRYRSHIWAVYALAIISKLDAVPIVMVLSAILMTRNEGANSGHAFRRMIRDALIYGVAVVAIWAVFCVQFFGSALPQSAYAKLRYHSHPGDALFPFLLPLKGLTRTFVAVGVLIVLRLVLCIRARRIGIFFKEMAPAASAVAFLALYCAFNPGERMSWYYAVPEYLVVLQGLVIACGLASQTGPRGSKRSPPMALFAAYAAVGILGALCWPEVVASVRYQVPYLRRVEGERMAVGAWIGENSAPTDTLMAGHGHIARNAGIYTWDYSGLNSKKVTDILSRGLRPVTKLSYQWYANHGALALDIQRGRRLGLEKVFYNISAFYDEPAWRVFHKSQARTVATCRVITADKIRTDGVCSKVRGTAFVHASGSEVVIKGLADWKRESEVWMGVVRGITNMTVVGTYRDAAGNELGATEKRIAERDDQDWIAGYVSEWRLAIPGDGVTDVRMMAVNERTGCAVNFKIIEPVHVVFLEDAEPELIYMDGWGPRENFGRWALKKRARIKVLGVEGGEILVASVAAFEGLAGGTQAAEVLVNSRVIGHIEVGGSTWTWHEHRITLPNSVREDGLVVEFRFERLFHGNATDEVLRGLPFADMRIEK